MNEDTYILGTVIESHVSRPVLIEGRPQPLYTITVSFDEPGDAYRLGLLYDAFMGPDCLNRVETREQLMHSTDITFESISSHRFWSQPRHWEFDRHQGKVSCALS